MKPDFTDLQGQYPAFIYHYTKVHGCPPAETDIYRYFRVLPPTAHQMTVRLERKGFISRVPGQARSITVLVPAEQLPPLE